MLPGERASEAAPTQPANALPTVVAVPGPGTTNPASMALESPGIPLDRILAVAGSNEIGATLFPALVQGYLAGLGATEIDPGDQNGPDKRIIARLNGENVEVLISTRGTTAGIRALGARQAEIALTGRPITDAEISALFPVSVSHERGSESAIGLDAVVAIVNRTNPVEAMPVAKLAKLFAGQARWKDVGGAASCAGVTLLVPKDDTATRATFDEGVMQSDVTPVTMSPSAIRLPDERSVADAVAKDPCAIGIVGVANAGQNRILALQAARQAIAPNPYTIRTGQYPLARRLYLYAPRFSPNAEVARFVRFARSPAGQQIIQANGYVLDDVRPPAPEDLPSLPQMYVRAFAGAKSYQPLSVSIGFVDEYDTLDPRESLKFEAIKQYVSQQHIASADIVLIGHAAGGQPKNASCDSSRHYALVVAGELAKLGISDTVALGFCDEVPVAPSETDAGQARNRRVEVWVPVRR